MCVRRYDFGIVLELAVRQIHTKHRVTGLKVIHQSRRDELADILLCFLRAPTDMWRPNHIGKVLQ